MSLSELSSNLGVDERTVRRDVEYLQELIPRIGRIELRRGKVLSARSGFGAGYFAVQAEQNSQVKESIARRIVGRLSDNLPIVITAGSSTFFVAREIRRAAVEDRNPRGLIAFTNSLPALMEFLGAGIATGIVGESFDSDDCAFHSHELHTAFHPAVAIVGASGIVADPNAGALELYSHRAEEAAFMKQLLKGVPEIMIAADASKIGRRHPWSFTSRELLAGKRISLFTSRLDDSQRTPLAELSQSGLETGFKFQFEEQ